MTPSVLDYNLDDKNLPEETTVDPGEYQLQLISAKHQMSNAGNPMVTCLFGVVDEPNAMNVFYHITLPTDGDDEKTVARKLRRLRTFYQAFGIDYSKPVDLDELGGETGFAILKLEEDEEYGSRNIVSRFVPRK